MPQHPADMTPHDRESIRAWGRSLECDVSAALLTSADARSPQLDRFCDALTTLVPRCRIERRPAAEPAFPSIAIGTRLRVYAVPTGGELEPFLAMMVEATRRRGEQAMAPAGPNHRLRLYVAPACPHCPRVLGVLVPRVLADPQLELHVIDATLFNDLAEQDRIGSVPTLILDDRLRMVGALEPRDVRELVGPVGQYSPSLFSRLLENGNLDSLARLLHERAEAPAALAELLCDATFSVRLAAMTLVEKLADADRSLAERLTEPVWERYGTASDPVRGDLLYVLGRIGTLKDLPRLQEVAGSATVDDVLEAAREAIEALAQTRGIPT